MYTPPDHIWHLILPWLKQPTPPPRSRSPRSALRQPHLCATSRVNKLFQIITVPILYAHPVTDDLSTFLRDFTQPSTQRLYSHCRSLHIEYPLQGDEPSILILFTVGKKGWKQFGLSPKEREHAILEEMSEQVRRLDQCLELMAETTTLAVLFPKLETIAVSSLYGVEDSVWPIGHWKQYERLGKARSPLVTGPTNRGPAQMLDRLLRHATVRAFCSRDHHGPLSVYSDTSISPRETPLSITHHFSDKAEELPIRVGEKISLVLEAPSSTKWKESVEGNVIGYLNWAAKRRACRNCLPKDGPSRAGEIIHIELFCSTADMGIGIHTPGSETAEEALERRSYVVEQLGASAQKVIRRRCGRDDIVTWGLAEDAPLCEACGSLPLP